MTTVKEKKGVLSYVKGDVTNPDIREGKALICHLCNDIGVFGAGVAKAVSIKFPAVKKHYVGFVDLFESDDGSLGLVDFCDGKVTGNDKIWIANMIGQHNTNRIVRKPIRYAALIRCMELVAQKVLDANYVTHYGLKIHCPKFGSDLAGGTWEFILELIEELWINKGVDVVIYEFD